MTPTTIRAALHAAEEFARRAKIALAETEWVGGTHVPRFEMVRSGKNTGAARRASLDLTRALADMRRPG